MKKYFFILSLLCLGLISCETYEPEPVKDPLDYTLVHIINAYYTSVSGNHSNTNITNISIFDSNGSSTGYGTHLGNYYVPKEGGVTINWTENSNGDKHSETFYVGNAQELWIFVDYDYAEVISKPVS